MGAQSFIETATAENVRKAFDNLVAEYCYAYGNDPYNGTISTCSLRRCVKTFSEYKKGNFEEAEKIIEKRDYGDKWVADYIDLGVKEYVIKTIKKNTKTYDAKYKQKFVVCDSDTEKPLHPIKDNSFDTKPKADEKAMKCLSEGKEVIVKKTMIKLSGNDIVTNFIVETKTTKTKPKLKPMPNRIIIPIHEYVFFGWASC